MAPTAGPRILTLDIETFPASAHVWSLYGEQNIGLSQITDPGGPCMIGAKWSDRTPVKIITTWDSTPSEFAQATFDLLDQADAVVTWNGDNFDLRHLRTVIDLAGLNRPSPFKSVDLFKVAKREFRALSNKLDYWAQITGTGSKIKHEGFGLWLACMEGDAKARARMGRYCRQDVLLTEALFTRWLERGWLSGALPHAATFGAPVDGCPTCGGSNLQRRGTARSKQYVFQRFQCLDCGSWCRGTRSDADVRPTRAAVK